MKRYRDFREECVILEHPNLKARILDKINPMNAIRDKIADLKALPGKLKDKAVDKLKDKIDDLNPMSPINKKVTMMRKDKISDLVDKKRDLTIKAKGIGTKIKSLRAKTAK